MRLYYTKNKGYTPFVNGWIIPYVSEDNERGDKAVLKFLRSIFRHNRQSFTFKITKI